ncbi:MAG: DNA mismatch repair protein MutS [Lachnospiraceae bacterium]|nr:DNA mismatch repair protein MutS [Lachnospiraceae bacterium]
MNHTETILEFDKIKQLWESLALTKWAKQEIADVQPCMNEARLQAMLKDTAEAKAMLEKCGNPPLSAMEGILELIATAQKGGCLSGAELEQIKMTLVSVRRMKDYLERGKAYQLSLAYYEENLNSLEELEQEISMQIRNGNVEDYATPLLRDLRSAIVRTEDKMREKADALIRSSKECMSDSFSTIRNGHICIPVKKEYKFRISGTVMDKSSTGNTLFIEPVAVAKYYEELQGLRLDEENEVHRILYTLSAMTADAAAVLTEDIRLLEKLDYVFSKGKLSLEYDGTAPRINTERRIRFENGRHPLMEKSTCVPLQFQIGDGINGIVITGPNTGGKTVAIKTVALNCYMAQCGLHVAAQEADICMNSNFLCDIGDGQNLSENLSTFSAHITNVLDILRKINCDSLVIMDELGSGTDPAEGMGIAIAILEELSKSGALYLVTTHYPEVKQYAQKKENVVNARMTFDRESLKPLYQLVIGEAGESCAFHIAKRLGMPISMLKTAAEAAYGKSSGLEQLFGHEPDEGLQKEHAPRIQKKRAIHANQNRARQFQRGDSVMVYPGKKIGIVCETANDKGVLRVQLPNKKIWINHKRIKLHVAAQELYPEDYDFSIIFDTAENRKLRHQMEKRHVEGEEIVTM